MITLLNIYSTIEMYTSVQTFGDLGQVLDFKNKNCPESHHTHFLDSSFIVYTGTLT